MEENNNDDYIDKEYQVYGKDINSKYILRKRDKCIFVTIISALLGVFTFNVYLIGSYFI